MGKFEAWNQKHVNGKYRFIKVWTKTLEKNV